MIFEWVRYWTDASRPAPSDHDGFSLAPDQVAEYFGSSGISDLASLGDVQCLVLLGEPGMGKSTALKAEYERVKSQRVGVFWLDLKTYESGDELRREISDLLNDSTSEIFVDSLDEGLLRVGTLFGSLVRSLRAAAGSRIASGDLRLRIACRAAEWPEDGVSSLSDLFGQNNILVRLLAPLCRKDVAAAADAMNLDAAAFLGELADRNAIPFAVRPVTLRMLLGIRARGEPLPVRQIDLYERGCLALAEEMDSRRIQAARKADGMIGSLRPVRRLAIARRLAALLIFCQRSAIDLRPSHEVGDGSLRLAEVAGGAELDRSDEFQVSEADVREVVETALFRSAGQGRFQFAHQTYAEFLAASYLTYRNMSLDQKTSLLRHPSEHGFVLAPQVFEAGAWAASHDPSLLQELIESNPEAMLRSDVASADPADRQRLVEVYLMACAKQAIHDLEFGRRALYSRLDHPTLADQLRKWICDPSASFFARRAALDITSVNRTRALEPDLLRLTLDEHEPASLRVGALSALSKFGGNSSKQSLISIALGKDGNDPKDELKGLALRWLWPDALNALDLISTLTPEKDRNLLGSYQDFLLHRFVPKITLINLADVVDAFVDKIPEFSIPDPRASSAFESIGADLMIRCFDNLGDTRICAAAAKLYHMLRKSNWGKWEQKLAGNMPTVQHRRNLAAALSHLINPNEAVFLVSEIPLLTNEDISWALAKLQRTNSSIEKKLWAKAILYAWDYSSELYERIYSIALTDSDLRHEFSIWIDGMPLNSNVAARLRDHWKWQVGRDSQANTPRDKVTCEKVRQCAANYLDRVDQLDVSGWIDLVYLLLFCPEGISHKSLDSTDLSSYPGWICLDDSLRGRLHRAACLYISDGNTGIDGPDSWWETPSSVAWAAIAGVAALDLVQAADPSALEALSIADWEKWVPAVIGVRSSRVYGDGVPSLLQRCLERVREPTIAKVQERISILLSGSDHYLDFSVLFQGAWVQELADIVVDVMRGARLDSKSNHQAIRLLIQHNDSRALCIVTDATKVHSGDNRHLQWATSIISGAMVEKGVSYWALIEAVMNSNVELARQIFLIFCGESGSGELNATNYWTVSMWESAAIFLEREFPPGDELESGFVTPIHELRRFRSGIPHRLAALATTESIESLERLAVAIPHKADVIRWALVDARRRRLQTTWVPPSPEAVLALGSRARARLVRSDLELQHVVLMALTDLQEKLQSTTPLARALWNESKKSWAPKDENFISDWIVVGIRESLASSGGIANREVEIRASRSAQKGQRTDIHVQAVMHSSGRLEADPIATVIVEVKGCWHRELLTAMKTQLRDRYLKDTNLRCGIYLIGWFLCDKWSAPKIAARTPSADCKPQIATRYFKRQAKKISNSGYYLDAMVIDCGVH